MPYLAPGCPSPLTTGVVYSEWMAAGVGAKRPRLSSPLLPSLGCLSQARVVLRTLYEVPRRPEWRTVYLVPRGFDISITLGH